MTEGSKERFFTVHIDVKFSTVEEAGAFYSGILQRFPSMTGGAGRHNFAETFEQHQSNSCP